MSTFVLIPGADGRAWYWHRVVPELRARGHEAITVDLPAQDSAGLAEHADAVAEAIGGRAPGTDAGAGVVLVAQSLAGFIAPLVCERVPVDRLVLLNAMVPAPGESAAEWWAATGHAEARADLLTRMGRGADAGFDVRTDFFHDVPPEITEEALSADEAGPPAALFSRPWPLKRWPDVPTRFLQGRDDRFFPVGFQRRVVRERLGLGIEEIPGGHLVALSRPVELVRALLGQ
ncbi:alpha/beta fold hydrolase [Streptomyces sp. NPDC059909]|uniref:alpha/beta fold hydrolase n=1 Tax=Streptomyces sp. NPDC059909 TaxID=3346998 RepID=UPI0036597625